ncbi:hypothetical protein [Oceaniradius stylonematis]|uniref:hypothetical protein n=1 Tax=Oceaniradius stylonematis TaxID=2184161 RepID=UPI001314B904|nr:hypothetical protein [Oceaniradius stylonematis]
MSEEFNAAEGSQLHEWGKELDEQFYRPQVEAEKSQREQTPQARRQNRTRTRQRAPSR